jgi:hypothetical protein
MMTEVVCTEILKCWADSVEKWTFECGARSAECGFWEGKGTCAWQVFARVLGVAKP